MLIVPSVITLPLLKGIDIIKSQRKKVTGHLDIDLLSDGCNRSIDFDGGFLPVACINQLITKLVTEWSGGYRSHDPGIYPNCTLLWMGPSKFAITCGIPSSSDQISSSCSIEIMTKDIDKMKEKSPHVEKILSDVIRKF
jgi:hypothetical protein